MLTRRQFVKRALAGSSLVAAGSIVPQFIARTASAAEPGGDTVLVVIELTGGNDGLNTLIPYGDDLYQKARPTLRYRKQEIIRVSDLMGLHPALSGLSPLLDAGQLALVQGVGYPNPNRSHFESMDIWQSADPTLRRPGGWLGRSLTDLKVAAGRISAFHLGGGKLPLALKGSASGVPSLDPSRPFGLQLGTTSLSDVAIGEPQQQTLTARDAGQQAHELAIRHMADGPAAAPDSLLDFVRRASLQTYKTVDRLDAILKQDFKLPDGKYELKGGQYRYARDGLSYDLQLAARMIQAGLGTRVFYVSLEGFDTHGAQRETHAELLGTLGQAIGQFFVELEKSGNHRRVVLMTFSEFGRRVIENGSHGTDHGAASCMFVAGPAVAGGLVGAYPGLGRDQLVDGDLSTRSTSARCMRRCWISGSRSIAATSSARSSSTLACSSRKGAPGSKNTSR